MKIKLSVVVCLLIILTSTAAFNMSVKAVTITDYVVQTNIQNGASGWYNTRASQIQLWWDGTYVVLKGPLVVHNVLYESSNGQWNGLKVEDATVTLQTSSDTVRFDVHDVFNSNWQVTTDRTRELTLSPYVAPTPISLTSYIQQTNIQSGVSGWYNTAQNQIQLWWSGTFVTLKGPAQVHNQLVDVTNGRWQIVEDTHTTLQTSTAAQTFSVTETFNSNWQPTVDYARLLTISPYAAPTTNPVVNQNKPMLATMLGRNDMTTTQTQTVINNWQTATGKGLWYFATVGSFGYPSSPIPMRQLDTYKPLVQQGLIRGVIYSWNPAYNDDQLTGQQCISDIVAGKYDGYIHQEAQRARNDGYPIIVRFGPEMNGFWAGWGNNSTAFVLAWQRIVNIFRQENAANVKWFWCTSYNSNPPSRLYTSYYPGDAYVDYVGIDLYANTEYNTWGTAERQFTDPSSNVYDTYTTKPFIVGEFGLNDALTDSQNAQWLSGFFDAVNNRSRIVAITHWHETWNGAAVDLYPQAFSVYKTRIANYLP